MSERTDHGAALVLVVDDDATIRQAVQWALEDEGLTVETAADGRQALKRAAARRPALVVLDMGLPLIDGAGVATALRTLHATAPPIVVITADGRASEKARQIGAVEYLSKPFEMARLVQAVLTCPRAA